MNSIQKEMISYDSPDHRFDQHWLELIGRDIIFVIFELLGLSLLKKKRRFTEDERNALKMWIELQLTCKKMCEWVREYSGFSFWNEFPIIQAANVDSLFCVKFLISRGADPSANQSQSLRITCARGQYEMFKFLMKEGRSDPSVMDNYCIRAACANGNFEIAEELLRDERVDPTDLNNDALLRAASAKRTNVVDLLLRDGRVKHWSLNKLLS